MMALALSLVPSTSLAALACSMPSGVIRRASVPSMPLESRSFRRFMRRSELSEASKSVSSYSPNTDSSKYFRFSSFTPAV